jgi:hypothetical protein
MRALFLLSGFLVIAAGCDGGRTVQPNPPLDLVKGGPVKPKQELAGTAILHAPFSDAPQSVAFDPGCYAWASGKGDVIYPPNRQVVECTTRPMITPTGSLVGPIGVAILDATYVPRPGLITEYTVVGTVPGLEPFSSTHYESDPIPVAEVGVPSASGFTVHVHADNVTLFEWVDGEKGDSIGTISLWDVDFIQR